MSDKVYVIFDGPPGHDSGEFIEVEDETGMSIKPGDLGEMAWSKAKTAGYYRLGPFWRIDYSEDLKEAEAKIERLIKAGDVLKDEAATEYRLVDAVKAWEEAKR